ncbi:hypothetical protein CCACVL1_15871 [Corchorus capsularis]|uniref:Uncharacterized protein n=1 Tax=Corchorus capsularis TaxID=210143 RepID=A0A1R3I0P4_COCAP|nr:hypothetical protein CCACVL1_15871 [Corchorus capsularis]
MQLPPHKHDFTDDVISFQVSTRYSTLSARTFLRPRGDIVDREKTGQREARVPT